MSRAGPGSASQSMVSISPVPRRIHEIVERTQYRDELQVCPLLAVQPWESGLTSLGRGFSSCKMGIILNPLLKWD